MRSRLRPGAEGPTSPTVTRMMEFKARFEGARPVQPAGQTPSAQRINFRRGESSRWREGVPSWESVRYKGLYEGIDLLVAGRKEGMKYEFHLAPGADWKQIKLSYEGINALEIRADGALVLTPAAGWPALVDGAPVIYQESDTGQRQSVAGRFRLTNPFTVGFEVTGAYDHAKPLIIDPELAWSTYVGGSSIDYGYAIAANSDGIYVTGMTFSSGWVAAGYDLTLGQIDAFVAKFYTNGQAQWSTYLGGDGFEIGYGIGVDSLGNVLVTGYTDSTSWVSGGFGTSPKGDVDAFVAKLSPTGAHLWSTFLGGSSGDVGLAIAADSSNNIYVAGETNSSGWVSGGFDTTFNSSSSTYADAFVSKISASGQSLVWSTYLGGAKDDDAAGIAVSGANVYVTGGTSSAGWVTGGANTVFNSGASYGNSDADGFASKLTTDGAHVWSTYLGGDRVDGGNAIVVDGSGNVCIVGTTSSSGWVSGGYETTLGGSSDAFAIKLSGAGAPLWSTYLGGSGSEGAYGIAVNAAGDIFVSGDSSSSDWIAGGFDTSYNGSTDAFVAKLSSAGAALWSSYLGGSSVDDNAVLALDGAGNLFVAGTTGSAGWVAGGAQTTYGGSDDAFLAKILDNGTNQTGSLNVKLAPNPAVAAGAQWRRVGTGAWRDSATTETGVATGTHKIEFKTIAGWVTPAVQKATIAKDKGTTASATYLAAGALHVTITPSDALNNGAQWRRVGTNTWLDSGVTEANLTTGTVTVEFRAIDGWVNPANQTVTIVQAQTTEVSGVYVSAPSGVSWSTYLGVGNLFNIMEANTNFDTYGNDLAVDNSGNIFISGTTSSSGWVSGGYDTTYNGNSSDAYVAKISSTGQFLWSTYLGGSGWEYGGGVALDGSGNVYVTGMTSQGGWVSGTYNKVYHGGTTDIFVVKLSGSGTHLWSGLLGGDNYDGGFGIAVDKNYGAVYVTGFIGFDSYIAKLSLAGQTLWEGILCNADDDYGSAVTVDGSGYVYVTGTTTTSGWGYYGYDMVLNNGGTGYNDSSDAFLTKLNSSGYILWNTYLGGDAEDFGHDVAVDGSGNVFVTGSTASPGWVSGGYDTTLTNDYGTFVVKMSSAGTHLWSTYLANSGSGYGIAVDSSGNAYATGTNGDALVVKLSPSGQSLWSRNLGGSSNDSGYGIAVDNEGNILVGGQTHSTGWVYGGFDTTWNGLSLDTFVAKLHEFGSLQVTISPSGAVAAGAKWRRVGTSTWLDSGATDTKAPVGSQAVEFKPLTGWIAPANKNVTITFVQLTQASGTYTGQSGSLCVTITPPEAVTANAQWRRVGSTTWFNSGATESNIPSGNYAVEFKSLTGWTTPDNKNVTINVNQTTQATGVYLRQTGSLTLTITPPEAAVAGARWRRLGTSVWYASGAAETNIPTGIYTLEFKIISGWGLPTFQTATINPNQTTTLSAVYMVAQCELTWSTYIGGSDNDSCNGVALDKLGYVYVTGDTSASGWISGGPNADLNGPSDAFVVKLTPGGQHVWSTYLGGSGTESGAAITVDRDNNICVAGTTTSTDGWIRDGFDPAFKGGSSDGFVVMLNSDGQCLWSTYLGGDDSDSVSSIAVDSAGNIAAVGVTRSSGWVSGGMDVSFNGGSDAFVVKLSPAGQHLWSSYLGGFDDEYGQCIAVDSADDLIVGANGGDASIDWISGGYDTAADNIDGFVVKLNPAGHHVWSSFIGGSDYDYVNGIAVDRWDNILLTGTTSSSDWATGGYNATFGGSTDAFALKMTAAGTFLWSTYLGGSNFDYGNGIATDAAGNIFVTGYTWSDGWISGGITTNLIGGDYDAYVAKISASGLHCWSTYLGGSSLESALGVAVDGAHNIYVAGQTNSTGWVSGGYNITPGWPGYNDGFLVKIHDKNLANQFGSLQVALTPLEAVTAGAQWRRVGTTPWLDASTVESSVPAGSCSIEFKSISDWTAPANQPIMVNADQTTATTATYVRQLGSLQVTITPPEAVTAGAQWRRVGTTLWINSGATESAIPHWRLYGRV